MRNSFKFPLGDTFEGFTGLERDAVTRDLDLGRRTRAGDDVEARGGVGGFVEFAEGGEIAGVVCITHLLSCEICCSEAKDKIDGRGYNIPEYKESASSH